MKRNIDYDLVLSEQIKYKDDSLFISTLYELKENKNISSFRPDDPAILGFIKELCLRTTGLDAYAVQILAALHLFDGNVIEMKTGEGKTLVAVITSLLHVFNQKRVHVVTANDYLAQRDFDFSKPIFEALNITSGFMGRDASIKDRIALSCVDVLYTTNKEIAINYSNNRRVNVAHSVVANHFDVLIVDEADLLMIDEARKPLSVGGDSTLDEDVLSKADDFVPLLEPEDFVIDEELKSFYFSDSGVDKIQDHFEIDNYYENRHGSLRNALKLSFMSRYFFKKDIDYIVKDDTIVLVNEQTGRLMSDFKMTNGLQQALEIKESLPLSAVRTSFTRIPYQAIFNLYKTKSGMTGTAMTEAKEFMDMYNLKVVCIPPNRPIRRSDLPDKIFETRKARDKAVISKIKELNDIGQPVIVGTGSLEHSESIARELEGMGIQHYLLNAKLHQQEASIIASAGKVGTVTIATNMAGRGADIKVPQSSIELGGLFVLGTERFDSRRGDNQLRGRCGRQGDIGSTQFFISLEDSLISNLNVKRMQQLISVLNNKNKTDHIENSAIANLYDKAQIALEGKHFEERKQLLRQNETTLGYYRSYFDKKTFLLECGLEKDKILHLLIEGLKYDLKNHKSIVKSMNLDSRRVSRLLMEDVLVHHEMDMANFFDLFNYYWAMFMYNIELLSSSMSLHFGAIGDKDLLYKKRVNQEYTKIIILLKMALIEHLKK